MAKATSKIDRAELYKTITGRGESGTGDPSPVNEPAQDISDRPGAAEAAGTPGDLPQEGRTVPPRGNQEETTYKTYKITEKQYQAILMKKATSKDPRYADTSAVVRAALDAFLGDIIENL